MADVGDQDHTNDAPTAPFRKIVLPSMDETVSFPVVRPGAAAQPPDTEQRPDSPSTDAGPEQPGPAADAEQGTVPSVGLGRRSGPADAGQGSPASGVTPQAGPVSRPASPDPGKPVLPPFPPPPVPPKGGLLSRIGDIPIRVIYLMGTILATVLAVLLVFLIFSGDVPSQPEEEPVVPVQPVPSASAAGPSAAPKGAPPVTLPAAPESRAFAKLPGRASAVSGTITDRKSGIGYPRLGEPWAARSFAPFSVAQRVGEVAVPQTVIASAMLIASIPESGRAHWADLNTLVTKIRPL